MLRPLDKTRAHAQDNTCTNDVPAVPLPPSSRFLSMNRSSFDLETAGSAAYHSKPRHRAIILAGAFFLFVSAIGISLRAHKARPSAQAGSLARVLTWQRLQTFPLVLVPAGGTECRRFSRTAAQSIGRPAMRGGSGPGLCCSPAGAH